MAWAKPAKAETSRTSRKSSTSGSCASFAAASTFRCPMKKSSRRPFIGRRSTARRPSTCSQRRKQLGGFIPERKVRAKAAQSSREQPNTPSRSKARASTSLSTTGAAVRLLSQLLRHEEIGKRIVPIIPDEARTFGMDSLFRQIGIYSPKGQLYEPVDRETLALL